MGWTYATCECVPMKIVRCEGVYEAIQGSFCQVDVPVDVAIQNYNSDNVRLGYNDAPSNTIKVHVQYPLQCYDKTKNYERFNTNDDEFRKLIVGMRRATFDVS